MTIQASIEQKLQEALTPIHLDVVNESSNHHVPPGSETHFKVVIVADAFDGKNTLARHRMVNKTLAHELANGVHALSMKVMTPAQWEAAGHTIDHKTPNCLHRRTESII